MIRPDQVNCVNRGAVGGYAAGTLLVTWADEVMHRAIPWNLFPHRDGGHFLALDAAGRTAYPLTEISAEQLRGAHVMKEPETDPAHVVGEPLAQLTSAG
jgi:hypothetical protein